MALVKTATANAVLCHERSPIRQPPETRLAAAATVSVATNDTTRQRASMKIPQRIDLKLVQPLLTSN